MSARAANRRAIASARIIVALAMATLTLGAPATQAFAAGGASAEGCAWRQHSKQVSKRVRRHGQWHRVKRVKRWWSCEAQPLPNALATQPALPTPPASESPAPTETEPEASHLGVKAVEYSYTLSRPEVSAGEVTVELNNQGEDPHNLVLEHEGTADPKLEIPSTPSVSQASAHFDLAPGTYRLYCSLYSHESKGMVATLVVGGG
jgi:plastocyanin